ncbi:MAG: hypothetical protein K2X67_04100 [Burkholderiales bacterium]|nr:hypothetical protein [Burkholderiales bacterium]
MRNLSPLLLLLALGAPLYGHAGAGTELEARQIETSLGRLQREQDSVYQQFQMTQELRRVELAKPDPAALPQNVEVTPPPLDYNELQRLREAHQQRLQDLGTEIERLYARYQDLEAKKTPLLQRLGELSRTP